MATTQAIKSNWDDIKGKIRSKWNQFKDEDLRSFEGDVSKLVGDIQRKTGDTKENVEKFLEEATATGAATVSKVAEKVKDYSHQAAESVQNVAKASADTFRHRYDDAEKLVKERPGESMLVIFGSGILAGGLLALALCKR